MENTMAPPSKQLDASQKDDEVISVTLSRSDYITLREMIAKQKSLTWIGKYIRNIVLVAAGGVLTLVAFGDTIKRLLTSWLGGS